MDIFIPEKQRIKTFPIYLLNQLKNVYLLLKHYTENIYALSIHFMDCMFLENILFYFSETFLKHFVFLLYIGTYRYESRKKNIINNTYIGYFKRPDGIKMNINESI